MGWEQWVSIIALVLAVIALIVGGVLLGKLRAARAQVPANTEPAPAPSEPAPPGPAAFVVNPIKVTHPETLRTQANAISAELGLPEPLWFETTPDDPGLGQAKDALEQGASVVVAAGGDGTVRAVATALAGTGKPMGLVPSGTGNLLAHNIDLPSDGIRALVYTALSGVDRPIDVGWIKPHDLVRDEEEIVEEFGEDAADDVDDNIDIEDPDALTTRTEHLFLVIGGLGFDAEMVAGADDQLKKRVGYFAYFLAGARHLHGRRLRVQLQVGDAQPQSLRLRTLLFANCGRLPGGFVLLPDAEISDGWLDAAAIDTRGGLLGWASLFGKVIMQGVGVRKELPASPASISFWRGRTFHVRCEKPEPVQLDGDVIGRASGLSVRVDAEALMLRVRS